MASWNSSDCKISNGHTFLLLLSQLHRISFLRYVSGKFFHLDSTHLTAVVYYHPYMWEGNVFILSVCLSIQAITFECLNIETSYLVWWDILTISKGSIWVPKSLDEGQDHFGKIDYSDCWWPTNDIEIFIKVKVISVNFIQGQGYLVKATQV